MKFKKLLSLAVVGAMLFAMAASAFALPSGGSDSNNTDNGSAGSGSADAGSGSGSAGSGSADAGSGSDTAEAGENSIAVSSSIEIPTVKVTVPATGAVVLNPYMMQFTIPGTTDTSKAAFYNAPIICTNESNCDLWVSASATATAGGEVVIVSSANDAKAGNDPGPKNVYLYLKTGTANGLDATSITEQADIRLTLESAGTAYSYGPSGSTVEKYLKLPYKEDPSYFGFQLDGAANTFTSKPWTAQDTVSVTIVLTFTPLAIAANAPA